MNQKELSELRRRFRPAKSAISRIYGCYVSGSGEILSDLDESLGRMPEEEAEKYLALLKKALSGTMGKNLMDIVFSTQQVADSPEHRLLCALRDTELKDGGLRRAFYEQVISALDMEGSNYLILLAHDCYDVPYRSTDGARQDDGSDRPFAYIVCVICPVKDGKPELGYFSGDNEFHSSVAQQIVSPPELGFLFPAFDDRAANLYNALYYTRRGDRLHQEFIDVLFRTEPPMSAAEQQEAFQTALQEGLEDACSLEVVQALYESLWERIEEHKQTRSAERLEITPRELGMVLQNCGVAQPQVDSFLSRCGELFGEHAVLSPDNLIDSKRFGLKVGKATVWVEPEWSHLVERRTVDGRPCLIIPVLEGMEVNGMAVMPGEQTVGAD